MDARSRDMCWSGVHGVCQGRPVLVAARRLLCGCLEINCSTFIFLRHSSGRNNILSNGVSSRSFDESTVSHFRAISRDRFDHLGRDRLMKQRLQSSVLIKPSICVDLEQFL